jgi:hypothetical protein
MKVISFSLLACGGGGGTSTPTEAVPLELRPRLSVQVAVAVMGPAGAPVVSRVAVLPLPLILPPVADQLLMLACTG